jgi:signal transduction histidine kinase
MEMVIMLQQVPFGFDAEKINSDKKHSGPKLFCIQERMAYMGGMYGD